MSRRDHDISRSDEDRELARLKRAQRRAAQSGKPIPTDLSQVEAALPGDPRTGEIVSPAAARAQIDEIFPSNEASSFDTVGTGYVAEQLSFNNQSTPNQGQPSGDWFSSDEPSIPGAIADSEIAKRDSKSPVTAAGKFSLRRRVSNVVQSAAVKTPEVLSEEPQPAEVIRPSFFDQSESEDDFATGTVSPLQARPGFKAQQRKRLLPAVPKKGSEHQRPAAAKVNVMREGGLKQLGGSNLRLDRRGVSRIIPLAALAVVLAFVVTAFMYLQPFKGDGSEPVEVSIPPATSVGGIADILKEKGVISNPFFFEVRARITGKASRLQAGTVTLNKGMSNASAISKLQQAKLPSASVNVVIPEGPSIQEVAATVKKAGVSGSYKTLASKFSGVSRNKYKVPSTVNTLEGFLFPATYELPKGGSTASELIKQQLAKFETEFASVDLKAAKKAKLTPYDVLIIASMIDREVQVESERPIVASVIYNRLKARMQLGIDATIRYASGNWSDPLKQSELQASGAYNTRINLGLPPTPIGNPGLASIEAAAHPATTKYLYYVVKPGGNGTHAFSENKAQFDKDSAAYNAAQQRCGGDPKNCTK